MQEKKGNQVNKKTNKQKTDNKNLSQAHKKFSVPDVLLSMEKAFPSVLIVRWYHHTSQSGMGIRFSFFTHFAIRCW